MKKRIEKFDILVWAFTSLFALLIIYPFYTAILTSIISSEEYVNSPLLFYPKRVIWDNYTFLLGTPVVWSGYQSTLLIVSCGLVYAMSLTVMLAYAFSRKAFPGKKLCFMLMLFTMFFGGGLVPMYLLIKSLSLLNSRLSVILMMGVSPFNVIVIKSSFEQLPDSLEEAARIDGANDFTIFLRVMLPLQLPVLATFALFISVAYWNEWFWSMILINDTAKFPYDDLPSQLGRRRRKEPPRYAPSAMRSATRTRRRTPSRACSGTCRRTLASLRPSPNWRLSFTWIPPMYRASFPSAPI